MNLHVPIRNDTNVSLGHGVFPYRGMIDRDIVGTVSSLSQRGRQDRRLSVGCQANEPRQDSRSMDASSPLIFETARLRLRPWRDADLEPFAVLNADPRVMEFFPGRLSREQSDAIASRIRKHFDQHGYGLWAVELPELVPFVGFVGLSIPSFEAHFTPCVEIGWRLACEHWGRGYASEAATAALEFGFSKLGLAEIVSFTTTTNHRSMSVMERIGMTRAPQDDFDHPALPEGHPLRRHVLYRTSPGRPGPAGQG
jgi:ribosomal-protein-alanine N-acetyltransferase